MSGTIDERLATNRTIGAAPPGELAWLAAHGEIRQFDRGAILVDTGAPVEHLWIPLSGHFAIHVDRGIGPRQVDEWREGDVAGLLPYSRMTHSPGVITMLEPTELLMVHRRHFPELIRECPAVTAALVHLMLDRARRFTSSDLHDEKMVSLGRIAAGLAHELNNPASASARSARLLAETLDEAEEASRQLAAAGLTPVQLEAIDRVRTTCSAEAARDLSPLEQADREDAFAAWCESHGLDADTAEPLVETVATVELLEALAAQIRGDALATTLRWLAASCAIRTLARDVERSASRIHSLVGAVKRFTYMDRQQSPEPIELHTSVSDSVALLAHKARSRSIGIEVRLEPTLPRVEAIGSDLSQIWTNLVDNALDAAPDSGHVTITAARELGFVIVRIEDDGPGIPSEIIERIFDPFYTTKPVGQGTGLGLDISRRLIRRNGGDLTVESRPGRTVFHAKLPVAPGG